MRQAKKITARWSRSGEAAKRSSAAKPRLLSGGNPQIAKGDGDAPVQAYIAAMPGWKREVGQRIDRLIVRNVPSVRKAVRWNSPFYGIEGQGWFLALHVFTRYVKLTFFRGASLRPLPPGESKQKEVRYLDIHENDLDEAQLAAWVKQGAALPGWDGGSPQRYGGVSLQEERMKKSESTSGVSASERIDRRIAELGDWRGRTLRRMRQLIQEADPHVVEEWKWAKATNPGTPTWSHNGILCTGESYKSTVKLTFPKGATLPDPAGLFNASLEGSTRRAIDIREGEEVDAGAFKALIRAAIALNSAGANAKPKRAK
jgi:hypothetical protein